MKWLLKPRLREVDKESYILGLGRGVAISLAKKGCTVVCWDVNKTGNDETVKFGFFH